MPGAPVCRIAYAPSPVAAIQVGGRMAKNLAFSRGDTVLLDLTFTTDGSPENLTGAEIFFTAKEELASADSGATIRKNSGGLGGITVTSAAGGTAQVQINPVDTSALPAV